MHNKTANDKKRQNKTYSQTIKYYFRIYKKVSTKPVIARLIKENTKMEFIKIIVRL